MRKTIAAILVCIATPVSAACPAVPDGPDSRYVENATARTLCLAREVAAVVESAAASARIEAELGNIEIQMQRQRDLLDQQLAVGWTSY
jgi:hypothetical protein